MVRGGVERIGFWSVGRMNKKVIQAASDLFGLSLPPAKLTMCCDI
jgi:hypothetical protein